MIPEIVFFIFLIHGADCLEISDYRQPSLNYLLFRRGPNNQRVLDLITRPIVKSHSRIEADELITNYPKSNLTVNKGDPVEVKASSFFSNITKLHDSYYSLPFIRPKNHGEADPNSTIYMFKMLEDQSSCNHVVHRITLNATSARELQDKIHDRYNVVMTLENHLPLIIRFKPFDYHLGYPLGSWWENLETKEERYFIYNHLSFKVKYHKDPETDSFRILCLEVIPMSYDYDGEWKEKSYLNRSCVNFRTPRRILEQVVEENKDILFTYNVSFEEVHNPDRYMGHGQCIHDPDIHITDIRCSELHSRERLRLLMKYHGDRF